MRDIHTVSWDRRIDKLLRRLPKRIREKFIAWVTAVELAGIRKVRERKGFHDEPLSGPWNGYRSVRLNRSYRVIYIERWAARTSTLEIAEINKHEY